MLSETLFQRKSKGPEAALRDLSILRGLTDRSWVCGLAERPTFVLLMDAAPYAPADEMAFSGAPMQEGPTREEAEKKTRLLGQVLQVELPPGSDYDCVYYNHRWVGVIQLAAEPAARDPREYLRQLPQTVQERMQGLTGDGSCLCACSFSTASPALLPTLYQEAGKMLQVLRFTGSRSTDLGRIQRVQGDAPRNFNARDLGTERELYLHLTCGDFDAAQNALEQMVAGAGFGSFKDISNFKRELYHCFQLSSYSLGFRTGREDALAERLPGFMGRFQQADTAAELMQAAGDFMAFLRSAYSDVYEGSRIPFIQSVKTWLDSSFTQSTVTATAAAEHFRVSLSYLSREFRKELGLTLSDYLIFKRLERAKELLLRPEYSVEQAAAAAGFASVKTFYRNFSRSEGITPTQFRKTNELH